MTGLRESPLPMRPRVELMIRSLLPRSLYPICLYPPADFSYVTTCRLMSLYAGLLPPRATSRGFRDPPRERYTPPLSPNTRSVRRPVENDGSAGAPCVLRRLTLPL